ncbi:MAG: PepSY domain-containing protein [Pseudomonadales bacterium]
MLAAYSVSADEELSVKTSDTTDPQAAQNSEPKEGKSVWLEKKISKPTRWLESLVKPMNIWLEGKVQAPTSRSDNQQAPSQPDSTGVPDAVTSSLDTTRISADEAADVARKQIAGNVLKVKLLTMPDRPLTSDDGGLDDNADESVALFFYRVRLISKRGEIHILYVDAQTAALIDPYARQSNEPAARKDKESLDE